MIPLSYNLRSLAVRKRTTFATAFGLALVVFVFSSVLMLGNGIERTLGSSGRPDVSIVLRQGADAELSSGIDDANVGLILAQSQVARDGDGQPLGVGEVVVVVLLEKLGTEGGVSNVQVRGVPERVLTFRPSVKIVDGRAASPGSDEVVIGRAIRGRFKGVDLGQTFELKKNRPVTVVGVFDDGGSSYESEIWGDLHTVRSAFGRDGSVSSVRVKLTDAAQLETFRAAVEQNKQLGLRVWRESEYYTKQSEGTKTFILFLGTLIAVFFAGGAMIGAMITMYGAVANRQREIGTLRALGFSKLSIALSFLFEAVALAFIGGAVGTVASLGMGFVKFSTMNFQSWSEIVFRFEPNVQILVMSLAFSCGMGVLGGMFPAWRASRMSPLKAIRA